MKKIILLLIAGVVCLYANDGIKLKSKVTDATVFKNRAMVTREAEVTLKKGKNVFIFSNLTTNIDNESVRVSSKGNNFIKILDVKVEQRFTNKIQKKRVKILQAKIDSLTALSSISNDNITILNSKKQFIESLKAQSVNKFNNEMLQNSSSPKKWNDMLNFVGKNLSEIYSKIRKEKELLSSYNMQIKTLQKELNKNNGRQNKNYKEIIVNLEAEQSAKVKLNSSYLAYNASWHPIYDARVNSDSKEVEINYFGMIWQKTGEDWNDISLTLSTAEPLTVKALPQLANWYLNVRQSPSEAFMYKLPTKGVSKETSLTVESQLDNSANTVSVLTAGVVPNVNSKGISTVFFVPSKSKIPSNNSSHKVTIAIEKLPIEFEYISTPKIAQQVYLKGKITNNKEYPLLSGSINVFVDNDFVNKTSINTIVSNDTLDLALGVENKINIEKKLINRFKETTGLLSGNNKITYDYEIIVKNNRSTEESILVMDQIPLSMNEEIKIELVTPEIDPDKLNKNGKLEWNIKLKPGEKKIIPIKYLIEYPSDVDIEGLE